MPNLRDIIAPFALIPDITFAVNKQISIMPTYKQTEFLARWRALRGYAPLRDDAIVSAADLPDMNMILRAEMDEWYTRLLLEGDPHLLEPENIAGDVVMPPPVDGCVTIGLPPGTVRVLSVRLSGWCAPATVITDSGCAEALRQNHPFTRAGASAPVAISGTDGSLRLSPVTAGDTLVSLVCVIRREGLYTMHPSALASIVRI